MRQKKLVTSMVCLLALTLVGMVALSADAQRRPGPQVPRSVTCEQPSRVQLDIFKLICSQNVAAQINLDQLTADLSPADSILKRIGQQGQATLLGRLDSSVDLKQESRLTMGDRVPVVQNITVSDKGVKTPSVSYESVGSTLKIRGQWRDNQPDRADVSCDLEISDVDQSEVTVSQGVTLPIFSEVNFSRILMVESDKPSYAMTVGRPTGSGADSKVTVLILRLVATRQP